MKKIILVNVLLFILLLVILEIFFSVIFYIKDEKNPLILSDTVIDYPYTYFTFIPQKKANSVIVNSDGLYSQYSRSKPKDSIRIILIGGSTARGMFAADYKDTIGANLEKLLQTEFRGEKIEVVNAGMSGYVVEQLFIFYQLVLSKYKPDIVVGLNGYNDLMSVKLNKSSGLYFAPQNMKQFLVIEDGKKKNTLYGRVSYIFPSLFRAAGFIKGRISSRNGYNNSELSQSQIENAKSVYLGIIDDIYSFCRIKGVDYIEFLQPIRWYAKPDKAGVVKSDAAGGFSDLYGAYESGLADLGYGYSLAGLFKGKESYFRDDCHFFDEGNEIIASAMAVPIKQILMKKLKYDKQN